MLRTVVCWRVRDAFAEFAGGGPEDRPAAFRCHSSFVITLSVTAHSTQTGRRVQRQCGGSGSRGGPLRAFVGLCGRRGSSLSCSFLLPVKLAKPSAGTGQSIQTGRRVQRQHGGSGSGDSSRPSCCARRGGSRVLLG